MLKYNDMKIKRITTILIAIVAAFSLCGCSLFESEIPELTEAQQDMIVEYASETLLSFDDGNGDKIEPSFEVVNDNGELVDINEILSTPEPTAEPENLITLPENETSPDATPTPDESVYYESIEEYLGLPGVTINYTGYDIADYYSENPDDYFVLYAQDGQELLILNFELTNVSSDTLEVTMPYRDMRYKISVNGKSENALTTLLLNDMALWSGTIDAGQSVSLVVVGEYDPDELSEISSLELVLKTSDGNISFPLN